MPTVRLPDGSTAQFPDGMAPKDIESAITAHLASNPARPAGLPAGMDLPGVPAPPAPDMQPSSIGKIAPALLTGGEALKGVAKSVLGTGAGLAHLVPGASDAWQPTEQAAQTNNKAQVLGKALGNAAQFLIPGGAEEEAAAKLAPYVGKALPAVKMGLAALGSGGVNAAQGGSFGTGAIAGGVGSGLGMAMKAVAPTLAESALKVTGNDRMYGRTVGQAILDDTKGLSPSAVEDSARAKIGQLTPQVEQIAADAGANGSRGSLAPARDAVGKIADTHTANRAVNSAAELNPLQNFLQNDAVTGLPLSANQTPTGLLQMKRGLDADFIGNWNPTRNSNNELDAAKTAYGQLADQFHIAAPGSGDLDQRVSSLFPVIDRANRASRGAGVLESTLNRFRTPTGALVGAASGGLEGYHSGGLPGALTGAAVGAVLPSIIANPFVQMAVARGANAAPSIAPAMTGLGLQLPRLNGKPNDQQ